MKSRRVSFLSKDNYFYKKKGARTKYFCKIYYSAGFENVYLTQARGKVKFDEYVVKKYFLKIPNFDEKPG